MGSRSEETITISHPSGKLDVKGIIEDGRVRIVQLLQTARVLMKGQVFYQSRRADCRV
jgi:2-methylaconitate cis-trans-isomerase PrpF